MTNYEIALREEMKRVTRSTYSPPLTYRNVRRGFTDDANRVSIYSHPDVPGVCFRSRKAASEAALRS